MTSNDFDISAFSEDSPSGGRGFPVSLGKTGWLMQIIEFKRKETAKGDLLECYAEIVDEECEEKGKTAPIAFFLWFHDKKLVDIAKRRFADLKQAVGEHHATNTSQLINKRFRGMVRARAHDSSVTDVVKFTDQCDVADGQIMPPPGPPSDKSKSLDDVPF